MLQNGKELLQRQISKSCEGIILPFYYHVGLYSRAICRQELYLDWYSKTLASFPCFKVGSHQPAAQSSCKSTAYSFPPTWSPMASSFYSTVESLSCWTFEMPFLFFHFVRRHLKVKPAPASKRATSCWLGMVGRNPRLRKKYQRLEPIWQTSLILIVIRLPIRHVARRLHR
jgi:hypothetical protein